MIDNGSILQTERLRLRRASEDDLAAFHAIMCNPVAMQFWSSAPHTSIGETAEWLRKVIEAPRDNSNEFVVEFEGHVIGKAGCWRLPEVGFIFDPRFWGHGFAIEAMRAVIGSTFEKFAVSELLADVDPRNDACLRLLEKLGFQKIGEAKATWQVGSLWVDSVYLSLPRNGSKS